MKTIFKVIIGVIAYILGMHFFFELVEWYGGIWTSIFMIFLNVVIYWLPKRSSLYDGYDAYERIRGEKNPIYKKHFRKADSNIVRDSIFSNLKGIYWFQIFAIIQMIVFLLYGIYSMIKGRNIYIEFAFLITILVSTLLYYIVVVAYYNRIIRKSITKTAGDHAMWKLFEKVSLRKLKAMEFPCRYKNYNELAMSVHESTLRSGYKFQKKFQWMGEAPICGSIYSRQNKKELDIFALVRTEELTEEHCTWLDKMFDDFLKEQVEDKLSGKAVCFWYLMCVDRQNYTFRKIFFTDVHQGFKRYYLPAGICFEQEELYYCRQKTYLGWRKYRQMRREILNMFQIDKKYDTKYRI